MLRSGPNGTRTVRAMRDLCKISLLITPALPDFCVMNKAELVSTLAEMTDLPKKSIEEVIEAFTSTVTHTLKKGDEVVLAGFGSFSAKNRAGRMGVNPQKPTEKIKIPPVTVPKFKAGKALKDALKGTKGKK